MTRSAALFAIIILFTMSLVPGFTADCPSVEKSDASGGWINWDKQMVKAVGHGILPGDTKDEVQARLMARAAAVADAYRNLASMVKGVRVSGDTYVKNYVTESDQIRVKVEGFIRGAEVVSERELSDRSYEIIMQAPLYGRDGLMTDLAGELLPECDAFPPLKGSGTTGLLIDARGLDVKPAMSPKVYDEDGREVYGTLCVSPDYAIQIGIAGYPDSMDQALKSARVGKNPMVIKALRRGTKFATDIVISSADAARIREADSKSHLLSRCRVSILLGPTAKVPAD